MVRLASRPIRPDLLGVDFGRSNGADVEEVSSDEMSAAARNRSNHSHARRKAPPRRARRSLLASRALELPRLELEAHHVDILALALIALGIFLGAVAYLGWAGGSLGDGAVTGMRFAFGALGYALPAVLAAGGAVILARELRPPARPLRTGMLCVTAAVT